MNRLVVRLLIATVVGTAAMPGVSAAAGPSLGAPVTLPDGTVLPAMPAAMLVPSAQAEMLAEHGGPSVAAEAAVGKEAVAPTVADPLVAANGSVAGPAGALPNGLGKEVLGWLPYWDLTSPVISRLRFDLVSTIAYFSIGVGADGSLQKTTSGGATTGWAGWTSSSMSGVINAAHARGVRVVPTITMHAWSYDYTAMTTLLNSTANRSGLVSQVVAMVRDRGADGVNIDFEPVPTSLRAQFTALVREMDAGLASAHVGAYVTVDTMAGAAAWSTGYDVASLATAADAIVVMAYDFSYAGSARAGGVALYDSPYIYAAADSMRDHLSLVSPDRMIWGVPYYGRAWNTSTDAVNATVRSPASSASFAYYRSDSTGANARTLAATNGRRWDAGGQVPYTVYRAGDGDWRQLYYDDPASIGMKYDMVNRNDIAGIGIWALGMDTGTSDLWDVIEAKMIDHLTRVAGNDRYATAAAVSSSAYGVGVPLVYVATGSNYPDALSAGPAAARGGGPVLLVSRTSVPSATDTELRRLKPGKIVAVGGSGAISDSVIAALRPLTTSGSVTRIAGADRYGTAAAVSRGTFSPGVAVAYLAVGTGFADALAGGAAAGRQGGPVLLTATNALPDATRQELARLRPGRIIVLGGTGVVSAAVATAAAAYVTSGTVSRTAGADRYVTAVGVSRSTTAPGASVVYLATGTSYPDGLAGAPPAARDHGPLLLTPRDALPSIVMAELRRLAPARVVVLGGTGAVSSTVMGQLRALWD